VLVAKGSKIKEVRGKSDLINLLQDHLGVSAKGARYERKKKYEVVAAALASFLLIAGVWFSFSQGRDTLITLETPIEYLKRNPSMEILETSVNTVILHLSGSGALIKSIRPGQVQVKLDLSNAAVGRNTFTITSENITLPPGVFVKKVQPSVVEATLDVPVTKEIPVQADWVGKMPDDLTIVSMTMVPDKVQVTGAKKIIDEISTVYTEKILLARLEESGTLTVNLALKPAALKLSPSSKDRIKIEYLVKKRLGHLSAD
jgi:YbbR domain-containing protein